MRTRSLSVVFCPACDAERPAELGVALDDYRYLRCGACGLMTLDPRPDDAALPALYDAAYYDEMERSPDRALVRALLSVRIYSRPEDFATRGLDRPGRVLDVGCGTGGFLTAMRARGWDVRGVDVSEDAVASANRRLGSGSAWCGRLGEAPHEPGSFDLVTFWHVLEHVPSPRGLLRAAHRFLRPGGRLAAEVPNARSVALRAFRRNYAWIMVPAHILYYTPRSFATVVEAAGFRVERMAFPMRGALNFPQSLGKALGSRMGRAGRILGTSAGLAAGAVVVPGASLTKSSEVIRIRGVKI